MVYGLWFMVEGSGFSEDAADCCGRAGWGSDSGVRVQELLHITSKVQSSGFKV